MTAVSEVIYNFDIIDNIVQHLGQSVSLQDLLSLALVSRTLSPIALDHMWRNLPTSYYILKLLPGFALVQGKYVSASH